MKSHFQVTEKLSYALGVFCIMKIYSESVVFGTSATIVRNDGMNVVETLFDNNAIEELSLSTAIARKVLPCPHYITAIYRLDDEFEKLKKRIDSSTNTKEEKQEFIKKMQEMKKHFEKSYGIPLILNKYIKVRDGRYLVFCKDKKHLNTMRDVVINWFQTAGIKDLHSYAVYSDYPDKEKDYKNFCEDDSEALKILFSINMLNEGVHIKDISGVLMLRTTQSNLVYLQQLGRLVEAENIDKYLLVFDFVNNFSSVNDGIGLLREIKNAIAREKEKDPNFDDSGFEDIDTFFVIEQILQVKEMFKEIEGRLEGGWENGLRHFDKYVKEHNGDVLVPKRYVDEDGFPIGYWVRIQRNKFKNEELSLEKIKELDERNFVWKVKNNFEDFIKNVCEFYTKFGRYPIATSYDLMEAKLGRKLTEEKVYMRKKDYPYWKIEIINKYLSNFSCETQSDKSFNEFISYVKLYKERYGHLDIKDKDVIDEYHIGQKMSHIKKSKLDKDKIRQLKKIGIDLKNKHKKWFDYKMEICKQAVDNGVIISYSNPNYKNINLYNWISNTFKSKYINNDLSSEEIKIVEELVGKSLNKLYNGVKSNNKPICVKAIDTLYNRTIGVFNSQSEASRIIREKYNNKIGITCISNRLTGKTTTPYKGRFMFYYADENEVVTE